MREELPAGTVTFLFTDVEGSTHLLHQLGADAYAEALAEHRGLIREACAAHSGVEVDTQGDAFFFAFPTAPGALAAASAFTDALAPGPILVRVGLHTGTPLVTAEGYVGDDVHRAARIAASGHGGQVLASAATVALVDGDLRDLGDHRFKDLAAPERVYQLGEADFPPLKTLHQTNLPIPSTAFLGRERELDEAVALLSREDVRLLTLTGPGGTGKTRLALQVAGALSDRFPHGVWWVPLAALDDPDLVLESASRSLGAKVDLAAHIADKRTLLLFDNFEHVTAAASSLASLLEACPGLELLVTSRERLHLTGEHEFPVPPLAHDEAIDFFAARASASDPAFEADDATGEICRRLDDLPLALELAAARVKALSTQQILERLERRLSLLTGGARDAPARQRTLRATIEWSHDQLTEEEQRLFARLAVFAGGCTLEAAEDVCRADLDTLQSLVEKSLLRFTDERYWMLETIREYAAEHLDRTDERASLLERLGRYLVSRAVADGAPLFSHKQAEVYTRFELDHPNTRAVMEWALSERPELASELVAYLGDVWTMRGHLRDTRDWIDSVLRARAASDRTRAWVLIHASDVRKMGGDVEGAADACEELVRMVDNPSIDPLTVASALADLSDFARDRGDLRQASEYAERSLEFRATHALPGARAVNSLAEIALEEGDLEHAERLFGRAADDYERSGHDANYTGALLSLAEVARRRGDFQRSAERLREALEIAARLGDQATVGELLQAFARLEADRARPARAAALWGAGERFQREWGVAVPLRGHRDLDMAQLPEDAVAAGAAMDVDEAVAYALSSED